MNETKNQPPIMIRNKGQYVGDERARWAKRFQVPFANDMPKPFPQPTLLTGRALAAIGLKYPAKMAPAIAELYKAFFVELQAIGSQDVIIAALSKVLRESEVEDVMNMATQAEAKKTLADNTAWAIREGAFGLPWFVATNAKGETAKFWGFSALGEVADHLGLNREEGGLRALL